MPPDGELVLLGGAGTPDEGGRRAECFQVPLWVQSSILPLTGLAAASSKSCNVSGRCHLFPEQGSGRSQSENMDKEPWAQSLARGGLGRQWRPSHQGKHGLKPPALGRQDGGLLRE